MTSDLNIIIIGGGAAGFFGAICAATHPHTQVTLLEAGSNPLTKVRISGGGRCNVTHHCFDPSQLVRSYPRGGKELRGAFTRFQPKDTIAWFESRGVRLKTEEDGRMFPITDNSETIVNCLMEEARKTGVKLRTNAIVKSVKKIQIGFEITLKTGEKLSCDRLLIATGSNNSMRYFEQYFGHLPHIFRQNRTSVAVLDGTETKEELTELGKDIFTYFGLGCRNVSQLWIPNDFDLNQFFEGIFPFADLINHHKYANN
ncbi:MAG: NAD(P)/FAD-dependent oxidoreductase, partial [Hydrococcus sp. Prado102]|nr:NAD(P)/FAD-dependent oxidoreductase [Hydrococcus sp. Prado102]